MTSILSFELVLILLSIFLQHHETAAHGLLTNPPPRGTVSGNVFTPLMKPVDSSAVTDFLAHFPSGSRSSEPGSGRNSQIIAANFTWTPFTPFDPKFTWRTGVCGDLQGENEDHMRGGRYYNNGMIVRSYEAGTVVSFETTIVVHHNGYFLFHLCDVSKCDGEISKKCFQQGACKKLMRTTNPKCDKGYSPHCGPIDSEYPGRWYLPCSNRTLSGTQDFYGRKNTMMYNIPSDVTCEHCVLQWQYTSANYCNPPGVNSYFTGPDGPKRWGDCPGQAGALGGFILDKKLCGDEFPEEYYQCADVRIVAKNSEKKNPIGDLEIGAAKFERFTPSQTLIYGANNFSMGSFKGITIRANMKWPVKEVEFFLEVDGVRSLFSTITMAPFFMFPMKNPRVPLRWKDPIFNKNFRIVVAADGFAAGAWLVIRE